MKKLTHLVVAIVLLTTVLVAPNSDAEAQPGGYCSLMTWQPQKAGIQAQYGFTQWCSNILNQDTTYWLESKWCGWWCSWNQWGGELDDFSWSDFNDDIAATNLRQGTHHYRTRGFGGFTDMFGYLPGPQAISLSNKIRR